jgi:cGMP-dependent 3',5'-cyclic phosphodiesterase
MTSGIAGHVATTGKMLNVKDAYSHPLFFRSVDERTGFFTRNILCLPIKVSGRHTNARAFSFQDTSGELIGVAELCNKMGRSTFTDHDEQIAAAFSVYCAISISHVRLGIGGGLKPGHVDQDPSSHFQCLLYRRLQEAQRRHNVASEMMFSTSSIQIADEDLLKLTVRETVPPTTMYPEFDEFTFWPRSITTSESQLQCCMGMFYVRKFFKILKNNLKLLQDLKFMQRFRVRSQTLARFLLMVQKGYRDVPFHNWVHAFSVGHFAHLLLKLSTVKKHLTWVALCHV